MRERYHIAFLGGVCLNRGCIPTKTIRASAEGICAAECALGRERQMDYRVVARLIFSMPEYSAVGLSEEEAQALYGQAIHIPPQEAA